MRAALMLGRSMWRRRIVSLLMLGLLVGLVGAAVLAPIAGMRRSATAFDRLVTRTHSPQALVFQSGDYPDAEARLRALPDIDAVQRVVNLTGRLDPTQDWYSLNAPTGGTFDDPVVVRGRPADPARTDEVVISERTSSGTGLHIGDRLRFRAYTQRQFDDIFGNSWTPPEGELISVRVVGVIRDRTDALQSSTVKLVIGTPAFAQKYGSTETYRTYNVWLRSGSDGVARFEQNASRLSRSLSSGDPALFVQSSASARRSAQQTVRVIVLALGLFALVAALAGAVIILQALRRSLTAWEARQRVLAALGATTAERTLAGSIALTPFVLIGVPVAILGAYLASAFFPVGSLRSLEPTPGMRIDPLVFAAGGVCLTLVLVAATVFVASYSSRRTTDHSRLRSRSKLVDRAGRISAPPAATVGAQFALAPGTRRRALPVRTALVGAVLAVLGVAGSIVFTASIHQLVTTPARFGLDWDLKMELANLSKQATLAELTLDPRLSDVAVLDVAEVTVEGNTVQASSLESRKGVIEPVMLEGRPPSGPSEIALGPKLLSDLGKHVGDRVQIETGKGTVELVAVGAMLSPESESESFNAEALLTPGALQLYGSSYFGQTVMRFAPHTRASTVTAALDRRYPYGVMDESAPNAPPEIRNLAQVTHIPTALGAFLALLGTAALAHALIITTGTRRRDLAVLRAIGFTRRQAAGAVAAMATTIAGIGLIGLPLGLVAGNIGWRAVTGGLHVESDAAIPLGFVFALAAVVLVLANLIAAAPAWSVARARPAAGLRAE